MVQVSGTFGLKRVPSCKLGQCWNRTGIALSVGIPQPLDDFVGVLMVDVPHTLDLCCLLHAVDEYASWGRICVTMGVGQLVANALRPVMARSNGQHVVEDDKEDYPVF